MVTGYGICLLIFSSILPLSMATGNRGKQFVCFGDSITWGARAEGHSWVSVLAGQHRDLDFVNAGKKGRKTSDKEQLLPVLKKYPSADYYLFLLGVNDLKDGRDPMVDSCVAHMEWMIAAVRKADSRARIVILAPPDINLRGMDSVNTGKKYNENTRASLYKLEKEYRRLAREEKTGFISLLHAVSPSHYADGLHPDAEGQKQIAAAVWKGLQKEN